MYLPVILIFCSFVAIGQTALKSEKIKIKKSSNFVNILSCTNIYIYIYIKLFYKNNIVIQLRMDKKLRTDYYCNTITNLEYKIKCPI